MMACVSGPLKMMRHDAERMAKEMPVLDEVGV